MMRGVCATLSIDERRTTNEPMKPFIESLHDRVLLADGGIGTQIYDRGVFINRCFEELNLSNAELIRSIHTDYLNAGAEIIETNTFRGNRRCLSAHGLGDRVVEINTVAVQHAKQCAGDRAYVAGAVGAIGVPLEPIGRLSRQEAFEIFAEQIGALDAAGVDVIILETFLRIDELTVAYEAARSVSSKPIIAQLSFRFSDKGELIGATPKQLVHATQNWDIAALGTNCVNGPEAALQIIEELRSLTTRKLCAMPNAGLPQVVEGRTIYMASPEYMAEYGRRLALAGANIVGGCCGTTPAEIQEIAKYLRSVSPRTIVEVSPVEPECPEGIEALALEARSPFGAQLGKKFQISVEVEPPKGLDPSVVVEGARFLKDHGVDAVNIADGARAIARMSPLALALKIRDAVEIETIIHYCCRDRNLLGMQMDLLGANALGQNNLLIVTGDPPKMGNFPHATAVFDVDSIGLLHFARMMNHGQDLSGRPLGAPASFVLGCGCNPGHMNLGLEIDRYRKKIEAGAEYVFSQPVYDPEMLTNFLDRTADLPEIPLLIGILPLASLKNAEFLHNEVPGMQIPDETMKRMRSADTKEQQRAEGIRIAQEALAEAKKHPRVHGAYIFPPFGKYEAVVEIMKVL